MMADSPYRCNRCGKVFEEGKYVEFLKHREECKK